MNTILNATLKTTATAAITTLAIFAAPVYAATGQGGGSTAMEECVKEAAALQYRHPAERKMAMEAQRRCEEAEFAAFETEGTVTGEARKKCGSVSHFLHPAERLARARAGC